MATLPPPQANPLIEGPFFAAARAGDNRWWNYAITLVIVILFVTIATAVLLFPLLAFYPSSDVLRVAPAPLALTAALLPFGAAYPALALGLRRLHRRPLRSLVSPGGPFRWRLLWVAGVCWFVLAGLVDLAQYLIEPSVYRWSFDPARFWPYLVAALLWMPVQTSAEELVFRGYLTQAVGLRARRVWLPVVVPALLFALLHLPNPEVGALGLVYALPQYLGIGLLLGWLTVRSQGLEMAIGLHLANNLYTGLVAGLSDGALPSASLFTIENLDPMLNLILIFIAGMLFLLLTNRIARRWSWRFSAILLLLLTACSPVFYAPASVASPDTLPLTDCVLSAPGYSRQVEARCGTLSVPEDPADPAGRKIDLNVAVIPAESSNPEPDPLFMLAGGPGQAATQAYLPILPAIERITFKRDVVLVDQRGTGQSNPLHCEFAPNSEAPLDQFPTPQEVTQSMQDCVTNDLDGDTRFYTTSIAMHDLDAVRQALGYGQINLLGVSYGTRAALTYMRLYPENVRTAVLDGVVPPGWVLGASVRGDAQRALDLIFSRCAADEACHEAFPQLNQEFNELLQQLETQPVEVTLPDPTTGVETTVTVTAEIAGAMVRLISYSSELSALLPWLVHSAAQGDLRPLASQYLLSMSGISNALEQGMFYAVICAEDVPYLPPEGETGNFFFYQIDQIWRAACQAYPENPQPAADREYPTLQIPTLIISGEADPVTPPANGDAAARFLPNSRHIVLSGMGHGNFHVGCVPNLLRQLIENASLDGMDTACVQRSQPLPFFLSPVGPQP